MTRYLRMAIRKLWEIFSDSLKENGHWSFKKISAKTAFWLMTVSGFWAILAWAIYKDNGLLLIEVWLGGCGFTLMLFGIKGAVEYISNRKSGKPDDLTKDP